MPITLLSDLGMYDPAIVALSAQLRTYNLQEEVVAISHDVTPYDLQQAAYIFSAAYPYFPKGTVHVIIIDVFGGSQPRIILAEKDGDYFIAPDNGILQFVFGAEPLSTYVCSESERSYIFGDWIKTVAGLADRLIKSKDIAGYLVYDVNTTPTVWKPKELPDGIECNILYIDHFENVTLDLTKQQFFELTKGRPFKIKITRTMVITTISDNYNDVNGGEPLCRFNAAGFMEIALNHGRAASLLGLGAYHTGNLQYQTIKIAY